MLRFSVMSLLKFVIGILLLQGVTVLLVVTAYKTDLDQTWPLFVALGGAIGTVVALWFSSIADSARHQTLAKAKEVFSKEREKIRVRAEQDKAREVKSTQKAAARSQRVAGLAISPKTGLAIGGAVGLGVAMLMAQFITLGLLTLTTAGGLVLGYGARVRQERYGGHLLGGGNGNGTGWLGGGERREVKVIDAEPAVPALEGRRRRSKPPADSAEAV